MDRTACTFYVYLACRLVVDSAFRSAVCFYLTEARCTLGRFSSLTYRKFPYTRTVYGSQARDTIWAWLGAFKGAVDSVVGGKDF